MYVCIYIYICIYLSLSLSLSIYIYIYIQTYMYTHEVFAHGMNYFWRKAHRLTGVQPVMAHANGVDAKEFRGNQHFHEVKRNETTKEQ